MIIHSITGSNIYYKKNLDSISFKQDFEESEYVKIPKKKYQREKILGAILGGWLFIDLIREIYKWIQTRPPKL